MKKLMIAACAVALAAVAQAAQVKWTGSVNAEPGITSGYYVALIDAATYTTINDAVAALIKDGTGAEGYMQGAAGVYMNGKVGININNKALPEAYGKNDTVSLWALVLDGSIGEDATAKNYVNIGATAQDKNAVITTRISDGGAMTITSGNVTGEWQSVPEPTSGLMLLLGMGALALRRRRA